MLVFHYKKKLNYRRNLINKILFVGKILLSTDLSTDLIFANYIY